MRIPNTLAVLQSCWSSAESQVRSQIAEKHFGARETWITDTLRGELRFACRKATSDGRIEQAFLEDMGAEFPHLQSASELDDVASGLTLHVVFHDSATEPRTGGDFGLVLARPDFQLSDYERHRLHQVPDHRRGLLVQAKLRAPTAHGRPAKWGRLTKRQRDLLPERAPYYALALYQYRDVETTRLEPILWQTCENNEADTVESWLKQDRFPSTVSTEALLAALESGRAGTSDPKCLREVITPPSRRYLEIRIDWPDGRRPPGDVVVWSRAAEETPAKQVVRRV